MQKCAMSQRVPPFPHIYRQGLAGNMLYAWFSAMHTRVDIMLVSALGEEAMLMAAQAVKERIAEVEAFADCFNPASELARYNAGAMAESELCTELRDILRRCEAWKQRTGGLFDVDVSGRTNLSGFIKGYALDAVKPIVERHGITSALINMGNSSIMAIGNRPDGSAGWAVSDANGNEHVLCDECLTSSGNDTADRRHIVNPATGTMITGRRVVSVLTKGGEEGEVMSTVTFIKNCSG